VPAGQARQTTSSESDWKLNICAHGPLFGHGHCLQSTWKQNDWFSESLDIGFEEYLVESVMFEIQ